MASIESGGGSLLEAEVDALVNTVNTVGIMGKGIALMFKERFPLNYEAYVLACRHHEVRIGKMFVTANDELIGPKWIVNFPTKRHWRTKTQLEWIELGLQDLVRVIATKRIQSIAIPALGCGNGGLDWQEVRPLIVAKLESVRELQAMIYEPVAKYEGAIGAP